MTDDEPFAANGAMPDPPQLSPLERIAELIEMLYLREPGFTGELLGELARCDTADLVKQFGSPSRRHDRASPNVADVSTVDTLPADQRRPEVEASLRLAQRAKVNPLLSATTESFRLPLVAIQTA
jgi:hypothetical protein